MFKEFLYEVFSKYVGNVGKFLNFGFFNGNENLNQMIVKKVFKF